MGIEEDTVKEVGGHSTTMDVRSCVAGQDKKLKTTWDNDSGRNRKESPRKEGEVVWACDEKRAALCRKNDDVNESITDKEDSKA